MSFFRVGVGIITYNRRNVLVETMNLVERLTRYPDTFVVVADDGSTDGTPDMLRARGLPVVTGANHGIAWNKNRALFMLIHMLKCDVAILLEDDVRPTVGGWDNDWIAAGSRYGHMNYAAPWIADQFLSGAGTAADPIRCRVTTGQCSVYSREAIGFAGYYDSRFVGYGHEHVEHTGRLIRAGYGGAEEIIDDEKAVIFRLIHGSVSIVAVPSFHSDEQVERNLLLARELMGAPSYQSPWRTAGEMREFRSEISDAMDRSPEGFPLSRGFRLH